MHCLVPCVHRLLGRSQPNTSYWQRFKRRCSLHTFTAEVLCRVIAAPQEMGRAGAETDADARLERAVVSAVLHLREHGWAVVDDVVSRYPISHDSGRHAASHLIKEAALIRIRPTRPEICLRTT